MWPERQDIRLNGAEIWRGKIYTGNQGKADPPEASVQIWDKDTGAFLQEFDITEFHQMLGVDENGNMTQNLRGPDQLVVDESGIVVHGHGAQWFLKIDHDGNPIWANGPGDFYGDVIPDELAAQFGLPHGIFAASARHAVDLSGKLTLTSNKVQHIGPQLRRIFPGWLRDVPCLFEQNPRSVPPGWFVVVPVRPEQQVHSRRRTL